MEEYRPNTYEKKKMVLDMLSLYDHPLVQTMRGGVARMPLRGYGKSIISAVYEQADHLVNTAVSIDTPHRIHEVVAKHAPHKLPDAHVLVKSLNERPLSDHRRDVEAIFDEIDRKMFTADTVSLARLTEEVINYHLRAKSDPVLAERIPKIKKIVETLDPKHSSVLLYHVLRGSLAPLGAHTIIDALAAEIDPKRMEGKAKFLLKVARMLQSSPDGRRALNRVVKRKLERVSLKDLIIYGLDSTAARRDVIRALEGKRR